MSDSEQKGSAAVAEETKDETHSTPPASSPSDPSPSPAPSSIKPSSNGGSGGSGGIKRKLPSTAAAGAKKPLIDGVGGSTAVGSSFSLFEPLPASSPLVDTFRDCLLGHFFPGRQSYPSSAQSSLPGPLPQSLTRRDLVKLEQGHYWVCEKSDGERAILLLHHSSRTAVLVDRSWACRTMRPPYSHLLTDLLAPHGDTVIDAELLEIDAGVEDGREGCEERRGALYRVSMFDVLAIDGEDVSGRLFGGQWSATGVSDDSGRMDLIIKRIQQPYKDLIRTARTAFADAKAQHTPPPHPPLLPPPLLELDAHLDLFTKTFVAKHHIDSILRNISHAPNPASPFFSLHTYRTSRGLFNLNDGLIFTPDRASYHCREAPLLKWKWPDLNTVDFVVEAPFRAVGDKGMPLLCAGHVRDGRKGGGGVRVEDVVFDTVKEVDEVSAGLLQEVARRGVERCVVECGYSRVDGEWHVKAVRWDKAKSNFLTTVVSTVKAAMDDLQSSDIVAACKKNKLQYRRQAQ